MSGGKHRAPEKNAPTFLSGLQQIRRRVRLRFMTFEREIITSSPADVSCFGTITPATLLVVDRLPKWNTGADIDRVAEFISDDAAIVALLLADWGLRPALIGTALGDDNAGHRAIKKLKESGVLGHFRISPDLTTPYELNVSDRLGGRGGAGGCAGKPARAELPDVIRRGRCIDRRL